MTGKKKLYIVVKNGISKKSNKPYSICHEVVTWADGGSSLVDKNPRFLAEIKPIGTRLQTSEPEMSIIDDDDEVIDV